MVRYLTARYAGGDDPYYQNGERYPLAIKTRMFRKKISIYKRRGYYDEMQEGSYREYVDMIDFLQSFKPVPEGK